MANDDIRFSVNGINIFDPESVDAGTPVQITVTNFGTETLTDLGIYIQPALTLGDVDNPADYPPESDYQDLLEWGTSTHLAIVGNGGLKITVPQNTGSQTLYFRRNSGSKKNNKISFIDLAPNDTATFTLTLETPPSISARRLYVDIVLD